MTPAWNVSRLGSRIARTDSSIVRPSSAVMAMVSPSLTGVRENDETAAPSPRSSSEPAEVLKPMAANCAGSAEVMASG